MEHNILYVDLSAKRATPASKAEMREAMRTSVDLVVFKNLEDVELQAEIHQRIYELRFHGHDVEVVGSDLNPAELSVKQYETVCGLSVWIKTEQDYKKALAALSILNMDQLILVSPGVSELEVRLALKLQRDGVASVMLAHNSRNAPAHTAWLKL